MLSLQDRSWRRAHCCLSDIVVLPVFRWDPMGESSIGINFVNAALYVSLAALPEHEPASFRKSPMTKAGPCHSLSVSSQCKFLSEPDRSSGAWIVACYELREYLGW